MPQEWRRIFEPDEKVRPAAWRRGLPRGFFAAATGMRPRPRSSTPFPSGRPPPAAAEPEVDEVLFAGIAAAMALVKAYRMHGHLAARLDPLGSEPTGNPALDETGSNQR